MSGFWVKAYHGTTQKEALQILQSKYFKITSEPYHWLGPGAYFYQDAPFHALAWAEDRASRTNDQPAVLESSILLDKCFDLLDTSMWAIIKKTQEVYISNKMEAGEKPAKQDPPAIVRFDSKQYRFFSSRPFIGKAGNNKLDNDVVKLAVQEFQRLSQTQVTSIRGTFIEGKELYPSSYFYDRYHVQIAIIHPKAAQFKNTESSVLRDVSLMDSFNLERMRQAIKVNNWTNLRGSS